MKKLFLLVSAVLLCASTSYAQGPNGKHFGIAVNPVLALFEWGSAEVNLWDIDHTAEINIPIQFGKNPYFFDEEDIDVSYFSSGVNYRRFFNTKQQGFFASVGWQFERANVSNAHDKIHGSTNSILFGMGYRLISENGLFWGFSLSAGRKWGEISDLSGDSISGSGLALDIDLFKFGYAW